MVQVAAILRAAEEVIFVSTRSVVRCPDPRRLQLDIDTGDTVRRFCPKLRELCGEWCSGETGENGGGFSLARESCLRRLVTGHLQDAIGPDFVNRSRRVGEAANDG